MTFTDPFPIVDVMIEPIVSKYLNEDEKLNYDVFPIKVLTQEPYRTFFEKITLEKELFKEDFTGLPSSESQERRARDFYDIHKLWIYYKKEVPITLADFNHMLDSRIKHRRNRTKVCFEEFNQYKLLSMFKNKDIRKQLETTDFRKLSIRDLDCDAIEQSLKEIDEFLIKLLYH